MVAPPAFGGWVLGARGTPGGAPRAGALTQRVMTIGRTTRTLAPSSFVAVMRRR
jgi:hypothetical protein